MINRILIFLPVLILVLAVGCETMGVQPDADNTPPVARFSIFPSTGDSTTSFLLVGHASFDAEDMPDFLEFRWDLNNDSTWDTGFRAYHSLIEHFPVPGKYRIRMEVRDRHGLTDQAVAHLTSYGINSDTSHFTDPRDGQTYRMVRIGGKWWMAENLNFGTMIRDTALARDNGVYEKYCYLDDPAIRGTSGGFYTFYHWDEVIDYDYKGSRSLCPPGWRMPGRVDWDSLLIPLIDRGLVTYFAEGGYSRLNLPRIGIHEMKKPWEVRDTCPCTSFWMFFTRDYEKDFYRGYTPCPYVWSSSFVGKSREYSTLIRYVNDSIRKLGGALPVRCIKIAE